MAFGQPSLELWDEVSASLSDTRDFTAASTVHFALHVVCNGDFKWAVDSADYDWRLFSESTVVVAVAVNDFKSVDACFETLAHDDPSMNRRRVNLIFIHQTQRPSFLSLRTFRAMVDLDTSRIFAISDCGNPIS